MSAPAPAPARHLSHPGLFFSYLSSSVCVSMFVGGLFHFSAAASVNPGIRRSSCMEDPCFSSTWTALGLHLNLQRVCPSTQYLQLPLPQHRFFPGIPLVHPFNFCLWPRRFSRAHQSLAPSEKPTGDETENHPEAMKIAVVISMHLPAFHGEDPSCHSAGSNDALREYQIEWSVFSFLLLAPYQRVDIAARVITCASLMSTVRYEVRKDIRGLSNINATLYMHIKIHEERLSGCSGVPPGVDIIFSRLNNACRPVALSCYPKTPTFGFCNNSNWQEAWIIS
ncbi:hypothetical protein EDB19DRAFT_299960 [Suillus lakei]|nr:hypothetical protein EDB19DRAFT_299960 [Suillus lakei]